MLLPHRSLQNVQVGNPSVYWTVLLPKAITLFYYSSKQAFGSVAEHYLKGG
jgi:hypothetical protein